MVDTFTCDSCGKNNVPTDDKTKLLLKSVVLTGGKNKRGTPQKATTTMGMEICPNCKQKGVIHNHLEVDDDKRQFGWHPTQALQSTYEWGQNGQQAETADKKD